MLPFWCLEFEVASGIPKNLCTPQVYHLAFTPKSCSTKALHKYVGRDNSVGIATGYGLDGPGIESRREARFSASVQTGPGAHPASCTMGTGSFPGVKSGRGVTLTLYPLLVPLVMKE